MPAFRRGPGREARIAAADHAHLAVAPGLFDDPVEHGLCVGGVVFIGHGRIGAQALAAHVGHDAGIAARRELLGLRLQAPPGSCRCRTPESPAGVRVALGAGQGHRGRERGAVTGLDEHVFGLCSHAKQGQPGQKTGVRDAAHGRKCKLTGPCPSSIAFSAAPQAKGRRSEAAGKTSPAVYAVRRRRTTLATAPAPSRGRDPRLRPVRAQGRNRARGLAPGRAAAEPAVEPRQSRRALRPHRHARSTTISRRTCSNPRASWPNGSAAAARRAGAGHRAAAASGFRRRPRGARAARSRGTATMPIYWRTWRAPSRRRATKNAPSALIWQALQLEPNEEGSLNWMISNANAKGGARMPCVAAYLRAAQLAGQLARAAVARALCARARRSGRGHAALRRGAGTRQPGAAGSADAADAAISATAATPSCWCG